MAAELRWSARFCEPRLRRLPSGSCRRFLELLQLCSSVCIVAECHGEECVFLDARMAVDEQIFKIVVSCKVFENSLERVEVEASVENGQNLVELVPRWTEDQVAIFQLQSAGQIENSLVNGSLMLEHIVYRRFDIRISDSEDNVKTRTL